jgi:ABC-type Co2+ transport system permease subunit
VIAWALALRQRKLKREMRARRLAQPAAAAVATSVLPMMMKASPLGTLLLVATAAFMLQRSGRTQRQQR